MTYFLILYKSFEYDINFTCKYLTSNKGKPVKNYRNKVPQKISTKNET